MMRLPMLYADHAATTPLFPEVLEAMRPWLTGLCGNPSSIHAAGRAARQAVEEARARVAAAIGARPEEIVFTSGGTESDTLAVVGGARARRQDDETRRRVLFPGTEHAAVREAALSLRAEGFEPVELRVAPSGTVIPDEVPLEGAALVSTMLANNETGVVFEGLPRLAARARAAGVLVHTDAVQAVGKVPMDVAALGVDLLSFTAHKLGGPKGVGALWVRRGTRLLALQPGGGQEKGRRGGTEAVAEVAGLAAALERAVAAREAEAARLGALRDRFERELSRLVPGLVVHGAEAPRLPGTSSVAFPGVSAETLLVALDLEGVAASSGSACSSGTTKPSRILLAAGVPAPEVLSTVRFSFGWTTTDEEVKRLLELLGPLVARVREASPDLIPGAARS